MIERIVDVDVVARFLFQRSSFTRVQLDTYLAERAGRQKAVALDERVGLRTGRRVSKGAFLATLKQTHRNFERALYSLLLMQYLGVIDAKTMNGLIKTAEILERVKEEGLTQRELDQILQSTAAIVNVAVKGS